MCAILQSAYSVTHTPLHISIVYSATINITLCLHTVSHRYFISICSATLNITPGQYTVSHWTPHHVNIQCYTDTSCQYAVSHWTSLCVNIQCHTDNSCQYAVSRWTSLWVNVALHWTPLCIQCHAKHHLVLIYSFTYTVFVCNVNTHITSICSVLHTLLMSIYSIIDTPLYVNIVSHQTQLHVKIQCNTHHQSMTCQCTV